MKSAAAAIRAMPGSRCGAASMTTRSYSSFLACSMTLSISLAEQVATVGDSFSRAFPGNPPRIRGDQK